MDPVAFPAQFTAGVVIVYFIQLLKKVPFLPFIHDKTDTLNRVLGALLGLVATLGITWDYNASMGDLVIHGLTYGALGTALWNYVTQLAMQKVLYDGVAKPTAKLAGGGK